MNDNVRKIMKGDVTMTSRPPHAPMPQRRGHDKAVAKVMQKDGSRKDCALLLRLFILITPHAHTAAPPVVALLCGLCCGLLTERDIRTEVLRKGKRHFCKNQTVTLREPRATLREPRGTLRKTRATLRKTRGTLRELCGTRRMQGAHQDPPTCLSLAPCDAADTLTFALAFFIKYPKTRIKTLIIQKTFLFEKFFTTFALPISYHTHV